MLNELREKRMTKERDVELVKRNWTEQVSTILKVEPVPMTEDVEVLSRVQFILFSLKYSSIKWKTLSDRNRSTH